MTLRAIIVGSGGQDGSLLYDLLLQKGYDVTGLTRTGVVSSTGAWNGAAVDISNFRAVSDLVLSTQPDEIYFLAAHHHSSQDNQGDDESIFRTSTEIHLTALVAFLEAIRRDVPGARLFYAASSHVFGAPTDQPQDESTPINPETVYGITKAAGLFACRRYRKVHGLFASVGILYNHESFLRSARFVSKKIATGVAEIKRGRSNRIVLGDLDASADWGYAPDYVSAMHRMLQLGAADDFILATGKAHSVRDFASAAFDCVGLNYSPYVETDTALIRRSMLGLVGNPAKFMATSDWKPSVDFVEMVHRLVRHELEESNDE
jgi:GDPmannose 4,6-dehydratase